MRLRGPLVVLLVALVAPAGAQAAFADEEARNFAKAQERQTYDYGLPDYRAQLAVVSAQQEAELARLLLADPERDPTNLCANHGDGCAGDIRYYDWAEKGYGRRTPVLWTSRSGATISGHVWATKAGPAKRPGIGITNGSVQAPEQLYWGIAASLAKRGYVVLTWDPQTQGRSDNRGEGEDRDMYQPLQDSGAFVDGTVDALDFFLSTPGKPFAPRRGEKADHTPKQQRRVAAGLNAKNNPFHELLDPDRLGIAGHSLGAFAVSQVAVEDPRVDAVVGWDNLRAEGTPRVPALGMSNDYPLTPQPYTAPPDPQAKNEATKKYSAAGVDTMQVNTRGGTHYEYSYIPNPAFGATLRGFDMATWYTAAWFDKYVKGDPTADRRLLTARWRADARTKQIDPSGDGNMLSAYLRSRVDIRTADGTKVTCEDLRTGCPPATVADDCEPANYSYLAEGLTADTKLVEPGTCRRGAGVVGGGSGAGAGNPSGNLTLTPCARTLKLPAALSRSPARLGIRLNLTSPGTLKLVLARRGAKPIRTTRRLRAGRTKIHVRLPRQKARYSVAISLRCTAGSARGKHRLRVR